MKRVFLALALVVVATSCTDNSRARSWGGTEEITLPENEVLLTVTWKGDQMWVLSRDTVSGTNHFREHSAWGVMEGEVILK
jgi:uncharacterized lipoprotein YehR (DUF1307 family)